MCTFTVHEYNVYPPPMLSTIGDFLTLGTLGYAEITGGPNISDSMKIQSIWNEDLKENARGIAVDLSEAGD